jgi:predicted cupin superfamily sugar epimerase
MDTKTKINKTADMKKYRRDRYQIFKDDMPNRTCERCGITVSYYAMSKHTRSKAHKRNIQNCVIYTYDEQNTSDSVPSGEIHSQTGDGLAEETRP